MENAMFERLELQSDDILQAYYMRSQSLLLLEYAGTLEETLGFSDSTDKPQAVLAQMGGCRVTDKWRKAAAGRIFSGIYGKKRRSVAVFLQQDECRSRSRSA